MLKWLRGLSALTKAVKQFESKCRVTGKHVEASALLQAAFNTFSGRVFDQKRLPAFIRIAVLCCLLFTLCLHLCVFAAFAVQFNI